MNIFKKEKKSEVKKTYEKPITPYREEKKLDASTEAVFSEKEEEEIKDDEIETEENFDDPELLDSHKPEEIKVPATFEEEKAMFLLDLSHSVRKLADAEEQLKTKRISWKSEGNLTGIMTLNEIISIAENLKIQIKTQGDILLDQYEMEDEVLNNKIKEFASDLKTYEFWLK